MAEAVDDGRTYGTDSGSGSLSEHGLCDQLIDPWCDLCFDDTGEKTETSGYCSECNSFLCEPCVKAHKKSPASKKHGITTGARMPKSQADKPVKYHDCDKHSGNVNENFCLDHGKMTCSLCTKEYHSRCNTSSVVDLWKKISSSDIERLKDTFSSVKKELSSVAISLQNNVSDIECQRKAMIKEAEALRDKVIEFARKLCSDTVTKITDSWRRKTIELANHVSSLNDVIHAVDATMSDIDKTMGGTFGPNQFIRLQDVIDDAQQYRLNVEKMNMRIHKLGLSLSCSSELSGFLNSCSQLGDITESKSEPDVLAQLPKIVFPKPAALASMSNIKRKQREISRISATKLTSLSASTASDKTTCNISGMDITSNGHLLLADYNNRSVKIVSADNQILSSLSVPSRPYDITVIDDNTAAVNCYYGEPHILDISYPTAPSVQRSLSLGYFVFGITECNNNLVVVCQYPSCVKMIDMTGQELWSVAKDSKGQQLFGSPWYVATQEFNNKTVIIVSDSGKKTLTVLDASNGKLIRTIDVAGKCPRGITTDDDGNVYVCYSKTREIGVWAADFTQSRIVLSDSDIQKDPCCIVYNNTTNELCVGYTVSKTVDRFRSS